MAAIFGVEELTGRAFNVNRETFRSLEVFSITALTVCGHDIRGNPGADCIGRFSSVRSMRIV